MAGQKKKLSSEQKGISEEKDQKSATAPAEFLTLDRLLDRSEFDSYSHHQLAEFIERAGIYRLWSGKKLEYCDGRSIGAEEALIEISRNFARNNEPTPDFGDYSGGYFDNEQPYLYGLPENKLPDWEHNPVDYHWIYPFVEFLERGNFANKKLCSITRLLLTGVTTPAGILCALEEYGVFKVDETNRVHYFKFEILDSRFTKFEVEIKEYAKTTKSGKRYMADTGLLNNLDFLTHGWPYDDLPDFDELIVNHHKRTINHAIAANSLTKDTPDSKIAPSVEPSPSSNQVAAPENQTIHPRTENGYLNIIGALLLYIEGKTTKNKHHDFTTHAALIDHLVNRHDNVPGISTSYLKDRLAKIKERYQIFGLPKSNSDETD